jgi:hypothetical protein
LSSSENSTVQRAGWRSRRLVARRDVRWPLALLVVAAALLAVAIPPASASVRPLYTGLSGVYDYTPIAFKQAADTGAKFVRIGIPWEAVAPLQRPQSWNPGDPADPNYTWGYVDGAIENAIAAGLTPMVIINSAPRWAQGCEAPAGFPESICEPDPAALAQFATAAARRFSGHFEGLPRVRYWQGLNEPNLSLYFLPQFDSGKLVSPYLYRKLINSFYAAIKSVDPSNIVLAAGLGPIAVPRYTVGPLKFARELLCMKGGSNPKPKAGNCEGGVHFDIFDIHPYTTGGPTHEGGPNDVELGDLPQLSELLKAADRAGRIKGRYRHTPLWVTEFSWDSKPPDPGGLSMKIETGWIDEALFRASRAGVERFFWFGLRDEPLEPGIPSYASAQSGLYFRGATVAEDRPKRIFYAFRFPFVAYPKSGGLLVWGRTPTGGPGTVAIQALKAGKWRQVRSVRADDHGMLQAVLPTGYGRDRRGSVRARFRGTNSVPFPMNPVKDFYQPPFGNR